MKKTKSNQDAFAGAETLSRSEMKKIMGGAYIQCSCNGGESFTVYCETTEQCINACWIMCSLQTT